MIQHAKNQFIQFVRSSVTLSFRIPSLDWPDPFLKVNFRVHRLDQPHLLLTMYNQKIFDQLLIFVNLYQHAQNETVSALFSVVMTDLKILQSEWLTEHFGLFSQIKDLCRNKTNNKNFHYRTSSGKINDHSFIYIQKNPIFGPFPKFLGVKKVFQKNPALSCTI